MFNKVSTDADFIASEHQVLAFWRDRSVFSKRRAKNSGSTPWSFIDGPITANNPMGVHHAWGRTYKDAFQRYYAMLGRDLRYQNGFDCQGLWVEVEVEKSLGFQAKASIGEFGIDKFVHACKRRVLNFAARQTEQSIRLGYWMDWDDPETLRKLAENIDRPEPITVTTPRGTTVTAPAEEITAGLGQHAWGGSYFTFSTENNETIWAFLKKCHQRGKIYRGYDVMPWSGRGGSAYSQMEVAEGRKLTVHKSAFVRFPIVGRENEYLLVWTTTPWTLTSNVAAAVNTQLEYVRLQAKRDGAIYYFARENLEYQRLAREFREGFGKPDWSWPKGVGKLKTLSQIFKEQGGYEILGTVTGAELVDLRYQGPFDDLPAQQSPGGVPENPSLVSVTGATSHRVVDGGRTSEGSPLVVAGEGTGIVHIAPGCGDVDAMLGKSLGLPAIAPLGDDGRFITGFGDFTGREAIDRATAELVFEKLKAKGMLVAVEDYPHIYPHCWRTGDELVFRLVDEWFINMDWRQEIMDVVRQIEWLPESIDGQARELEWLTNMRDWMISKKRFWGLALPIWVDDETGDFEVIGSLAELKERAVAGWSEFAGHTPHRPWIDAVKIRNPKTGNLMSRIPDVGNPWLDAGIVPFSTLQYNSERDYWRRWYPADLVSECFPGQFRNWFYALLSMATMMDGSPPFRTLFGYRLAMNEDGEEMHKSTGTAIWFEEAAEQLGVDAMRWLYLQQNPAADLRFGTRDKDKPVTLQTPDGPISQTKEGWATCAVTSRGADEVRRQVLIPWWNTYAFFVNYAVADGFDPRTPQVPLADRPEIDRWLLSNLNLLIESVHRDWAAYNPAGVVRESARFIDDLSNWYVRRNRRRFWRSKNTADSDKQAAYQTLYQVLVTLSQLLAPAVPFVTERMYQNLVRGWFPGDASPESVHLCDYPQVDPSQVDPVLSQRMSVAQTVVTLGHGLRERADRRVRQPLSELRFSAPPAQRAAIEQLSDVIREELNVKQITACDNLDDLVSYSYKPNLKTLGPRYGRLLGRIGQSLGAEASRFHPLRRGENVTVSIDGTNVVLEPADVLVSTAQAADWAAADSGGVQIAVATKLTPELIEEGVARDFVRQVQQLRKDADLDIQDRIRVQFATLADAVRKAVANWNEYIRGETLAVEIRESPNLSGEAVSVGEHLAVIVVEKA
jgi:isoleucyl-tRNA synthetase